METKTTLITGAAGFIGPHVVKNQLVKTTEYVLALDNLSYAANLKNLEVVQEQAQAEATAEIGRRLRFLKRDINDVHMGRLLKTQKVTSLVNLASPSHVDRSIAGGREFQRTAVQGTQNLLEALRTVNSNPDGMRIERAVFVSTDETYGSIDRLLGAAGKAWYALTSEEPCLRDLLQKHQFRETDPLWPGNPYAACKAAGDMLVHAYVNTHGPQIVPAMVTRSVNNYGPFQHPEKFLPLTICTLLKPTLPARGSHPGYSRRIPLFEQGTAVREWVHTEDHATAIQTVLERGMPGEIYNVGSGQRFLIRDLVIAIFKAIRELGLSTPFRSLEEACFDASGLRPGHDLAYALDASKLLSLGWQPRHTDMEEEVCQLVDWYAAARDWWEPVWDSLDFHHYWSSRYAAVQSNFGTCPFVFFEPKHYNRSLCMARV